MGLRRRKKQECRIRERTIQEVSHALLFIILLYSLTELSPFFDPYLLQVIHWDAESPGTRLQAEFSTIHAFPSSRHQSHFSSLSFLFTFAQSRTSCWIKYQIGTFLNESKRSFNGATSCISLFGLPLSRTSNATNSRKSFHINS